MARRDWIEALQIMIRRAEQGITPEPLRAQDAGSPEGQEVEEPEQPAPPAPASGSRITWSDIPVQPGPRRSTRRASRPAALPPVPSRPAPSPRPARRSRAGVPPAKKAAPVPPEETRVEWDGAQSSGQPDLEKLIGIEDAFEHTPLEPGERVAYCQYDHLAYHLSTWEFLRKENGGRCCSCGRAGTILVMKLPGEARDQPLPAPTPQVIPTWMSDKEALVGLEEVYNYVGHAVVVEAQVYEVYKTANTGTYFVRFEERQAGDTPFSGFKVVVFPGYEREWTQLKTSPRMYAGQRVRVRGLIQVHPTWGIEILVNSPRVIQIIDE